MGYQWITLILALIGSLTFVFRLGYYAGRKSRQTEIDKADRLRKIWMMRGD